MLTSCDSSGLPAFAAFGFSSGGGSESAGGQRLFFPQCPVKIGGIFLLFLP